MLTKGRSLKYLIVTLLAFLLGAGFLMPLSASASQIWEAENNNGVATATNVTLGAEVAGNLSESSDKDYYKFTLPADGYVTWDFGHDLVSNDDYVWEATLFDVNSTELVGYEYKGSASSADRSAQLGLPKGSYYLLVEDYYYAYGWDSATYRFKVNFTQANNWETEFNGGVSSADPISLNTAYNGSLRTSNDEDYYKFTLPADGYVTWDFGHDLVSDDRSVWEATLFDANANKIASYEYKGSASSVQRSAQLGLPKGSYYLLVEDYYYAYGWDSATYRFKVNYTQANNWETEFNDGVSSADPISLNTAYNASLRTSSDEDYFRFKLENNAHISISFQHNTVNDSDICWEASLLDADSNTVRSFDYDCNDSSMKRSESIRLNAGTYYFKVEPRYHHSDYTYTFKLSIPQPAAKVTYGAWKTEKKYCSTYKVRQSRSVTKTPYVWNSSKRAWVLNTKAASTTKAYRNYNMTAAEKKTCSSSSVSKSGWKQISGKWYYYNASGAKLKGWLHTGGSWYFLDKTTGVMKTGWLVDGGKKYWLSSSGAMITGWKMAKNGNWYYFDGSGAMVKGWLRQGNTWYYLLPSGVMAKGTVVISGRKSAFSSSGAWLGYR